MGNSTIKPNLLSAAECLASGAYSVEPFSAETNEAASEGCEQSYVMSEALAQDALALIKADATPDSTWWQLRRFLDQWQSSGGSKVSNSDNNFYGEVVDPNTGVTFAGEADGGISAGSAAGAVDGKVFHFTVNYRAADGSLGAFNYQRLSTFSELRFENGEFVHVPADNSRITSVSAEGLAVYAFGSAKLQTDKNLHRVYIPCPLGVQVVYAKAGEEQFTISKTEDGIYYVNTDTDALQLSWMLAADDSNVGKPIAFKLDSPIPWGEIDEKISGAIAQIKAASGNEILGRTQELLSYLETRRQYSWKNPEGSGTVREAAWNFLQNSNCYQSASLGADMLAQAGLPIRIAQGVMSSGKLHAWVELYHEGKWVVVDFTPTIKSQTPGAFTSAISSRLLDLGKGLVGSGEQKVPVLENSGGGTNGAGASTKSALLLLTGNSSGSTLETFHNRTIGSTLETIHNHSIDTHVQVRPEVVGYWGWRSRHWVDRRRPLY